MAEYLSSINKQYKKNLKNVTGVSEGYQGAAKSFAENPVDNYQSAVTDFSKSITDSLGITSYGSDDKKKKASVARHRYILKAGINESAEGTGVHQSPTWKDLLKNFSTAGMRTKDLRRMYSNYSRALAEYQERMSRHQDRMTSMSRTRMSVARRASYGA